MSDNSYLLSLSVITFFLLAAPGLIFVVNQNMIHHVKLTESTFGMFFSLLENPVSLLNAAPANITGGYVLLSCGLM